MDPEAIARFREAVWVHYRDHGRDLPWRRTRDPYEILVSEVMLQQTQVVRVLPKYEQFLTSFPTVFSLADAPVADVLAVWQGLGYNRRALALRRTAACIVADHGGVVPDSPEVLTRLPGIGPATAAAVCVFAYGRALPFIETNIRSALIHCFFPEDRAIPDADLLPFVEASLDRSAPRDWYYALMDYGAWVKKTHPNPSRRSRHYAVQSRFAGSNRQLRALILRALLSADAPAMTVAGLRTLLPEAARAGEETIRAVVDELAAEGFLVREGEGYRVA